MALVNWRFYKGSPIAVIYLNSPTNQFFTWTPFNCRQLLLTTLFGTPPFVLNISGSIHSFRWNTNSNFPFSCGWRCKPTTKETNDYCISRLLSNHMCQQVYNNYNKASNENDRQKLNSRKHFTFAFRHMKFSNNLFSWPQKWKAATNIQVKQATQPPTPSLHQHQSNKLSSWFPVTLVSWWCCQAG